MTLPKRFAWPCYLAAAAFILNPIFDVSSALWPFRPGNVQWRYGAVGLLANGLLVPVTGLLLATWVAYNWDHFRTSQVLRVIAALGAIVALIMAGMLVFDGLQTRASMRPDLQNRFVAATGIGVIKLLLASLTMGALAISAKVARRAESREHNPLVVGTR